MLYFSFEDFLELATPHLPKHSQHPEDLRQYDLFVEWETGQTAGRSCWGGELSYHPSNAREPELPGLQEILNAACPNLSFHQYSQLTNLVSRTDYCESDYYRNKTHYQQARLNLVELYRFLVEQKIMKGEENVPDPGPWPNT